MENGPEKTIIESPDGQVYVLLNHPPLGEDTEGTQFAGPSAYLGKGQFGVVTIALAQKEGGFVPVAAKQITLDRTSPQFEAQYAELQKECAIMKHLGRQGEIIEVHSDNPHEMKLYMMQDVLLGVSLKKYLNTLNQQYEALESNDAVGRMRLLNLVINAFIATCEATQALHDRGVIHGDLHTNNILVNLETGQAAILDFGMSHLLAPGQESVYVAGADDMGENHRAPETLSPQSHREGHEDERVYYKSSDLYSLAIDFSLESDMMLEMIQPKIATREVGQFMQLCYDLSHSPFFVDVKKALAKSKENTGFELTMDSPNVAENRVSLTEAIQRLKGIQAQLSAKIAQQTLVPVSESALQQVLENRSKRNLSKRSEQSEQRQPKRAPPITQAFGQARQRIPQTSADTKSAPEPTHIKPSTR